MAGNGQEFTKSSASLQNVDVVFAIFSYRRQLYIFTFRRLVWLCSSPFRTASISIFIPVADTGATRINTKGPEMDYLSCKLTPRAHTNSLINTRLFAR